MPCASRIARQQPRTAYIIDFLRYFLRLRRVHLVLLYLFRSDCDRAFRAIFVSPARGVHSEEANLNSR